MRRPLTLVALAAPLALAPFALADKADQPGKAEPRPEAGKPARFQPPPLPPSTEDLLVADLVGASWASAEKAGYPKGVQWALVGTDPVSTGQTVYLKIPAGAKLPLHTAPHGQHLTMVGGKGAVTLDGKVHPVAVGSYVVAPPKSRRELACDAGADCVFVSRSTGPGDVTWLKK